MANFSLLVFAILAGCLLPLQAGINSALGSWFSRPVQASFISFVIGSIALLVYCLVLRLPWPTTAALVRVPGYVWTGGILGAFYVTTTIIVAPKLGASVLTACLVAGQLLAALLLDHFGVVGFPLHAINAWRIAGASLIVFGVILVRAF